MSLSVFASLSCLGSFCSPFRCTTTPTTGSALQKGPRRGVLPPTHAELHRRNREERASWTLKRTAELHNTLSQFEKLCTVDIDSIFFLTCGSSLAEQQPFTLFTPYLLLFSSADEGWLLPQKIHVSTTFTISVSSSLEGATTYCFLKPYHLYCISFILCYNLPLPLGRQSLPIILQL